MDKSSKKVSSAEFIKQERFIMSSLGIFDSEMKLNDRATLLEYIEDLEEQNQQNQILIFEAQKQDISPINFESELNRLIEQCQQISYLATTSSALWCFDYVLAFFKDLERFLLYADAEFKQNFVLVLKIVNQAQERLDLVAIADLFYGEIPSLLRNLRQQQSEMCANIKAAQTEQQA